MISVPTLFRSPRPPARILALALLVGWVAEPVRPGPPPLRRAARLPVPTTPAPLSAEEVNAKEVAVKVAFLYNFTKLVKWPAEAHATDETPFVLAVFGRTEDDKLPLAPVLEKTLAGKSVGKRPIVVRYVDKIEQARDAHILYLGASLRKDVRALVRDLGRGPVLLVSSMPDFAQSGGTIGFSIVDGKLKFAINRAVAEEPGLKLSSKLLSLATLVNTVQDEGG